jgi:ADP-heptose:LPS heptosyltransferase/lauroyl/myristoyl acyltransferase
MIFRPLIGAVGYVAARLPVTCVALLCQFCGRFFLLFFRKRRRIILSNLAHAFPEKTETECKILARKSCAHMIELGLLAIALPYFSKKRIRQSFQLDDSIEALFREKKQNDGPRIVLLPHFSQMEAMTVIPSLSEAAKQNEIGVIYRPFKNRALEHWIHRTREKFGLKLLARGMGFFGAKAILKRNGIVVILFDQNANDWGVLSTFCGRVASTTPLPDLLYGHFRCPIYGLMPQRMGVFRAKCFAERLNGAGENSEKFTHNRKFPCGDYGVATAMNMWLEQKLLSNEGTCCDWLWAHNRWHTHDQRHNWLNLSQKRCAIDFARLAKKVKIFIRMPNWLGDVIMAIPLVKAVRRARPDAQITLLVRSHFVQFLENLHLADCVLQLAPKSKRYYRQLFEYRRLNPDFLIRLVNSTTGDIETFIMAAAHAFAQQFPRKKRPLFSERIFMNFKNPQTVHQEETIRFFAQAMGYEGDWDLTPLRLKIATFPRIGLICGSENSPAKRWQTSHWIALIGVLLGRTAAEIMLFGTPRDTSVTRAIKDQFQRESRIVDRAGETNLSEFAGEIATCKLVIGNDTGGVHLSNFLGIPTVVLFGPTNPDKTRPIFEAPVYIIKSPDKSNFATLTPNLVAETLADLNLLSLL